jgi:hypothetical protein
MVIVNETTWRNFKPRLSQEVAERFRQIEEGTLEALSRASGLGNSVMEKPAEAPLSRP